MRIAGVLGASCLAATASAVNIGQIDTLQSGTAVVASPEIDNIQAVPEPSAFLLLGGALLAIGMIRRRV